MSLSRRQISYAAFLAVVCTLGYRTLSRWSRPLSDESSCEYECALSEFTRCAVYPVWFVDEARTRFLADYKDPNAQPIRIEELATLEHLVAPRLREWYKPELG